MGSEHDRTEAGDVEFFGVRLKVNNPHLAALLNSSVTEDVQVIAGRAKDVFSGENRPASAAGTVTEREDRDADPSTWGLSDLM